MNTLRRTAVIAASSSALVLATTTIGVAATTDQDAAADKAITCDSKASSKNPFYDGPSASQAYDSRFAAGPKVPGLNDHTPQGLGTWPDWDGKGNDLLLVASYGEKGKDAHLAGIDAKTGKTVGTVAIAETHAGGVTVSKGWAFVQGKDSALAGKIRKYKLSDLRAKLTQGGVPYLEQDGTARSVYAASFLSSYGDTLYAGKFKDTGRGKMYAYKVNDDGSLTTQPGAYEVPTKTQGLLVTKDHFIYSTSWGRDKRSNIYVVDAGARDIDKPSTHCFRAPSMSEGMTGVGGDAYLVFESGSYKYTSPRPLNVIKELHRAKLSELK